MSNQPLFDDLDGELNKAYEAEQREGPNCTDPISVEHIGHDVESFTDSQMPREIREEILGLLCAGKFEVKYQNRLGKRFHQSAAIVHFRGHVFVDGVQYLLYYSAQPEGETLVWQMQAVFNINEIFSYHWDE